MIQAAEKFADLAKELEKAGAIALVIKKCLAGVASCAEMIDGNFKLTRGGHAISPAWRAAANVKYLALTPSPLQCDEHMPSVTCEDCGCM
jgi:hypothetical protein